MLTQVAILAAVFLVVLPLAYALLSWIDGRGRSHYVQYDADAQPYWSDWRGRKHRV